MVRRGFGFTLIEILIVMLIISIVAGAALMMITHNKNTRMEALAKELVNSLSLAETQATLQPAILGFAYTTKSFQFYEYQESTSKDKNPWRLMQEHVLSEHRIPHDLQLSLVIQGKVIPATKNILDAQPTLIISTSGDITPFIISISNNGEAPRYQVIGEANGSIHSAAIQQK